MSDLSTRFTYVYTGAVNVMTEFYFSRSYQIMYKNVMTSFTYKTVFSHLLPEVSGN